MLRATVFKTLGHTHVKFGKREIDFSRRFRRLTMKQVIIDSLPAAYAPSTDETIDEACLDSSRHTFQLFTYLHEFTDQFIRFETSEAYGDVPSEEQKRRAWTWATGLDVDDAYSIAGDDTNLDNLFAMMEAKILE